MPGERARDRIRVVVVDAGSPALARLRAAHPGGTPTLEPTRWAGALGPAGELVAAIGWMEELPGQWMVVEVNRVDDRFGAVGVLVLMRAMIARCKQHGIRVQALVRPSNDRLRRALTQVGGRCVIEVWE